MSRVVVGRRSSAIFKAAAAAAACFGCSDI